MTPRFAVGLALLALLALLVGPLPRARAADDLTGLDLTGEWYVLIHYKDDRSADAAITKFKDLAWSIAQSPGSLRIEQYPYVLFGEELELVRRHAMTEHIAWEPDAATWAQIRQGIGVSGRAMTSKRLKGSVAEGYTSSPPSESGGLQTVTLSVRWDVAFAPQQVRIAVTDTFSGGALEESEESRVYVIRERVGKDELRGTYEEATRHGTLRMVRSAERRVVK